MPNNTSVIPTSQVVHTAQALACLLVLISMVDSTHADMELLTPVDVTRFWTDNGACKYCGHTNTAIRMSNLQVLGRLQQNKSIKNRTGKPLMWGSGLASFYENCPLHTCTLVSQIFANASFPHAFVDAPHHHTTCQVERFVKSVQTAYHHRGRTKFFLLQIKRNKRSRSNFDSWISGPFIGVAPQNHQNTLQFTDPKSDWSMGLE